MYVCTVQLTSNLMLARPTLTRYMTCEGPKSTREFTGKYSRVRGIILAVTRTITYTRNNILIGASQSYQVVSKGQGVQRAKIKKSGALVR